ncbi:MAG: ATP-dependent protease subunit HslV [Myxococcales bacterium]|nr:ATP-dependent protease subunit HslV [Myxococcales bacterium]USN50180.1 MAG: ATP-dependent protease subunit HslV [Myxococcales bacterium]
MGNFMFHATTILAVRKNGHLVLAGDGQVSLGQSIVKANANKLRTLCDGQVLAGFAGSTADAFKLFDLFEAKIKSHSGQFVRAAVELAKEWRSDRILRRLEAMLLVGNKDKILLISGTGDVLEPDCDVHAIGSGGHYALAAARALSESTELDARTIAQKAMNIAADICVYTNHHHVFLEL